MFRERMPRRVPPAPPTDFPTLSGAWLGGCRPPSALCSHLAEAPDFCAGLGGGLWAGWRPRGPYKVDHGVFQRLKQRLNQNSAFSAAGMALPPQREEGDMVGVVGWWGDRARTQAVESESFCPVSYISE